MTDIVKWLREQAANDFTCEAKLLEAADEIEKLQKVLSFAAGYISTDPGHAHQRPEEILKWLKSEALGGK